MAYKEKDTKKWTAQWFETNAKGEKKKRRKRGFSTKKEALEIKNIATEPEYQGKGYGKVLIDFVAAKYKGRYSILQVGTGDSPLTISFYEKCGFIRSYSIKNFFIDNYDHPIYEAGMQLIDMIMLQRKL